MRMKSIAFAAMATLLAPLPAAAEDVAFMQLTNVEEGEALEALSRLAQFQQSVREGRVSRVELLAGGAASSTATLQSARDLLDMLPLDKALFAEKLPQGEFGRERYRFSVFPDGLGQIFWQVDLVMASDTEIARVTVLRKIPAPY